MSLKARIVPVAMVALLAACGIRDGGAPPQPQAPPPATAGLKTPVLENMLTGGILKFQDGGVFYASPDSTFVSWTDTGTGVADYALRVTGGRLKLPSGDFQPVKAFIDPTYGQIISFGQPRSGSFPSKISVINVNAGSYMGETGRLFHPGHIKDVAFMYGVNTPEGVKDVLVVAALSNISELAGDEPYVPVIFVADRSNMNGGNMKVMAYEVVSPSGQALELKAEVTNGAATVSFRLDRDPPGVRRSASLTSLFNPAAVDRAQKYQRMFK